MAPPPPSVAPPAPYPGVGLEIHEWGVLDVRLAPASELALAGVPGHGTPRRSPVRPPPPSRPHPFTEGLRPRAPIVYVHLPDGHAPLELSVHVTLAGGVIEEEWPLPSEQSPGDVLWALTARPGHCAGSSYPTPGQPACDDAYCESSQLALYETTDAACLTVGGHDFNHLFYRGIAHGALPIEVTSRVLADGSLHVRASGALGQIALVHRDDDPARTLAHVIDAPAAGAELVVPAPDTGADTVRAWLDSSMREAGLSAPEMTAFHAAWDVELFGGPHAPEDQLRRGGDGPPCEALLFWLPRASIDAIAPMQVAPLPDAIHRAILVRIDVDPVGSRRRPAPGGESPSAPVRAR